MLEARAIRTIEEQKECCKICGMEHDADLLYYAIFENDTDCLGTCAFRFKGKPAELIDIKPQIGTYDDEAMYILGKATLNFIDLVGFKEVHYLADDEKMAKLLEFYPKDGNLYVNLEGYFNEPCKRKDKKGEQE